MKQSTMLMQIYAHVRRVIFLLCVGLLLFHLQGSATAQTASTSTVSGRVVDSHDDSLVGAEVELHNASTGLSQKQLSNGLGQYLFAHVLPGEYDLRIQAPGFR